MNFAIRNALVAVPAAITLLIGIAFIVLCFLFVVEAVRTMPYLKQALKIYIKNNTPKSSPGQDKADGPLNR